MKTEEFRAQKASEMEKAGKHILIHCMCQEVSERKDDHTMTSAVWYSHMWLSGLSHMESSATLMVLGSL